VETPPAKYADDTSCSERLGCSEQKRNQSRRAAFPRYTHIDVTLIGRLSKITRRLRQREWKRRLRSTQMIRHVAKDSVVQNKHTYLPETQPSQKKETQHTYMSAVFPICNYCNILSPFASRLSNNNITPFLFPKTFNFCFSLPNLCNRCIRILRETIDKSRRS
jgi:hypothetical protein